METNMKSKKKRLIIAVSMLLLSAALLGTASFAWFGMNTTVEATGIEVEAYSDSQYLQISKAIDSGYGTAIDYESGQRDVRLVTYGIISNKNELVKLTINPASGNYSDATTKYYKLADSDVTDPETPAEVAAHNFIYANGELELADPVTSLYKDIGFVMVVGGTYTSGTYYVKEGNNFAEKTLSAGNSTHGLYQVYAFTAASGNAVDGTVYYAKDGDSDVYTVVTVSVGADVSAYYTAAAATAITGTANYDGGNYYQNVSGTFSKADTLALGSDLTGYYTVTASDVTEDTFDGANYYYLINGEDYSCLGKPSASVDIVGYLYWGRAYSTDVTNAQAGNTLNIVNGTDGAANYYYQQVLYLRQAEGTNHADNLKISKVTVGGEANDLSDALRVLFVAKSTATGEVKVIEYNNETGLMTDEGVLYNLLLGDEQEVVKVDLYVFYDGKANVANNASAAVLNGQTVEIEFSINELSYNK